MGIVTTIFDTLSQIITNIVSLMGNLFDGVAELFYVPGQGGAVGSLTFIGVLSLVAVGLSLFWLGFKFIRSLVKTKG